MCGVALKPMGFELYLLSNAKDDRVERFCHKLGVNYISRADKQHTDNFKEMQHRYSEKYNIDLEPKQMAHIGNNIIADVASGNTFGAVTCLVRNVGILPKVGRTIRPFKSEGQKLRKELLGRDIWRKHHLKAPNDQYYQLEDNSAAQKSQGTV